MQQFEIFKPGKHIAASGHALSFTESDLEASIRAYDPAIHEAPIVVGHPKDNGPAYGWVSKLEYADGAMVAHPSQVDPRFTEMVESGRFKKRSASFYAPDAPNNPVPGTYYLRHVGFLGAMPPAIKGLKDVSFNENEEGVIEFADSTRWAWSSVSALLRGLRDWLIAEKGIEIADRTLPNYYLSDLDAAAREPSEPSESISNPIPSFTEATDMTLTPAQIAELQAKAARADFAETELAKVKGERDKAVADFSELQTEHTKIVKQVSLAGIKAAIDPHVKAGRVLPAEVDQLADFATTLDDGTATFDFGEGDGAKKVTARGMFLAQLGMRPKVVEYREVSGPEPSAEQKSVADAQASIMAQVTGAAAK